MEPSINQSPQLLDDDYQAINQKLLKLTSREWDVVVLMGLGMSTSDIASCLIIENKSIQNYKRRIGSKLGLRGRDKLSKFCIINRAYLKKLYQLVNS